MDNVPGPDICSITGWRRLSSSGSQPYTLQEALVTVIFDDVWKSVNGPDVTHESMICAGGIGVDTCRGDGGGSVVCWFHGKWYMEGVTSWYGCAAPKTFGVYAKVRNMKGWVEQMHSNHTAVKKTTEQM